MWFYSQSSGELYKDDTYIGTGYSGHGEGINNPAMEDVFATGPLPRGCYTIGNAFTHPATGPTSMRLVSDNKTDTYGRSGFLIHGDNSLHNESASEGCIVLSLEERLKIATSDDRELTVVA